MKIAQEKTDYGTLFHRIAAFAPSFSQAPAELRAFSPPGGIDAVKFGVSSGIPWKNSSDSHIRTFAAISFTESSVSSRSPTARRIRISVSIRYGVERQCW